MKTINEIIKALRCTNTPRPDCDCDFAQIAIDAADMLEKIQWEMETDIKLLSAWKITAEEKAKVKTEPTLKAYYDGKAESFYEAIALTENTKQRIDADAETEEAEK